MHAIKRLDSLYPSKNLQVAWLLFSLSSVSKFVFTVCFFFATTLLRTLEPRQEVQNRLMKNPMHNIPFLLPQAYPSCPIMTVFKWL